MTEDEEIDAIKNMTDKSGDLPPQGPTPEFPTPDNKPWQKFKIVTKLGMHYDVLWQGDMKDIVTWLRLLGYFMSPAIYVERDAISHILSFAAEQTGEGATVTPLHPIQ